MQKTSTKCTYTHPSSSDTSASRQKEGKSCITGAIKCCKEIYSPTLKNARRNIPFFVLLFLQRDWKEWTSSPVLDSSINLKSDPHFLFKFKSSPNWGNQRTNLGLKYTQPASQRKTYQLPQDKLYYKNSPTKDFNKIHVLNWTPWLANFGQVCKVSKKCSKIQR